MRRHAICWLIANLTATALSAHFCIAAQADESLSDADVLRLKGSYDEAVEIYEKQRAQHPVRTALGLARCHIAVGDYDQAKTVLKDAAADQANSSLLHAELAS